MLGYSSYSSSLLYYKCMTNQKENRVVVIYNAVFVRSEADSNRCTRFCRPLPSHSAIRPFSQYTFSLNHPKTLIPYSLHPSNPGNPSEIHESTKQARTYIRCIGVQIYKLFRSYQNLTTTFIHFSRKTHLFPRK